MTTRLYDIRAEMSVLGPMIMHGVTGTLKAMELVEKESFSRVAHQTIFETLKEMALSGEAIDIVTLRARMEKAGTLEGIGGVAYLMQLEDVDYTTAHLPHYAKIVRDREGCRGVWEYCSELVDLALNGTDSAEVLIQKMQEKALTLASNGGARDTVSSAHDAVSSLADMMTGHKRTRYPIILGVKEVDNILGPLQQGEMTILGARPGVGKSHMAMQYAYNSAKRGIKTLFVSCEMTKEQLVKRLACRIAGIDSQILRVLGLDGLTSDQRKRFTDALRKISVLPLTIADQRHETLTATRIASLFRSECIARNCEFGVIDYLQRIRPETERHFDSREQEVAFVSHTLASIAQQLDIPLLVVAQINRQGTNDPSMEDLRESGAIEADAHNIVLLHAEADSAPGMPGFATLKVKVEKQREGMTGHTDIAYRKNRGSFTSLHDPKP